MRRQEPPEQVVLAAVRGVWKDPDRERRRDTVDGRSDSADNTHNPSSALDGLDSATNSLQLSNLTATQSVFVFGHRSWDRVEPTKEPRPFLPYLIYTLLMLMMLAGSCIQRRCRIGIGTCVSKGHPVDKVNHIDWQLLCSSVTPAPKGKSTCGAGPSDPPTHNRNRSRYAD